MIKLHALLRYVAVALALTSTAAAQDYPTKPVRILVPFPPGGINDIVGRLAGAQLSERLGKQFVVENKTGAGGIIAGEILANAPKDGHTLMIVSMAIAVNPHMYKMTYDTLKDFAPIAILATAPNLLSVNAELPAKSIQEVIALAKAKPGDLKYASSGVGTFMHLGPELFKSMAGVDILHVPFRGAGPAMIDVMGGHSHLLMNSYLASVPHIRSGKLKPLGVSDTRRTHLLPDVPTIDEAGVPGYQAANWWGIGAPAGTPQTIVAKLNTEINAVLDSPEVKKQFETDGAVIVRMSPPEFAKFFEIELEKWGKVVKEANIKPE